MGAPPLDQIRKSEVGLSRYHRVGSGPEVLGRLVCGIRSVDRDPAPIRFGRSNHVEARLSHSHGTHFCEKIEIVLQDTHDGWSCVLEGCVKRLYPAGEHGIKKTDPESTTTYNRCGDESRERRIRFHLAHLLLVVRQVVGVSEEHRLPRCRAHWIEARVGIVALNCPVLAYHRTPAKHGGSPPPLPIPDSSL